MNKLSVICLAALLMSCAQTTNSIQTSIPSNFSIKHKSYAWAEDKVKRLYPDIAKKLVADADQILTRKGYVKSTKKNADFLMSFNLNAENTHTEINDNVQFHDFGIGVNCQGGDCTNSIHKSKFINTEITIKTLLKIDLNAKDTETTPVSRSSTAAKAARPSRRCSTPRKRRGWSPCIQCRAARPRNRCRLPATSRRCPCASRRTCAR